jgi:hypothetical protein
LAIFTNDAPLLNVTQRTANLSASSDIVDTVGHPRTLRPRIIVKEAGAFQQDKDAKTVLIAESSFLPPATQQNADTTDSIIERLQQFHPTVAEEFVDQVVGLTEIGLLRTDIPRSFNDSRSAGSLSTVASVDSNPTVIARTPTVPPSNIMRSRSVSFVPAPDPSILPPPSHPIISEASLTTVPSSDSDSEPIGISSALNESLASCYDNLDDAGRQNLMFSAMASRDHSLSQSLFNLQKTKGTFTLPKLSGKLLEQATKQKLPTLAYDKDATKRRYYWNTWYMKLQIILGLFSPTAKLVDSNGTISPFDPNEKSVANAAIYILIHSYILHRHVLCRSIAFQLQYQGRSSFVIFATLMCEANKSKQASFSSSIH